jgi:uncharacterized protein YbjQ (UPF0145 family)
MPREAVEALDALSATPDKAQARAATSDLSIDEVLLLHAAGWEAADLVTGVAVWSMPYGTFFPPYGQNDPVELSYASQATSEAFRAAGDRLREDCARSVGVGVVGVEVEVKIGSTTVVVALSGTAVRRIEAGNRRPGRPFITDLSTKDFVLLERAGWEPVDLASGASFVAAPYQRLRQVVAQTAQNVELVNLTRALQDARELAMERMQRAAATPGVAGVVDVSIIDGPVAHARHTLAFICWGTAVRLVASEHQRIEPELVLPVNDDALEFEATSLRSANRG